MGTFRLCVIMAEVYLLISQRILLRVYMLVP